jgi:hypothetical protein
MPTLLAVATPMCDANMVKIIIAAKIAREDVFDGRPLASLRVEAQRVAADQALADPIRFLAAKGAVGGGDLI